VTSSRAQRTANLCFGENVFIRNKDLGELSTANVVFLLNLSLLFIPLVKDLCFHEDTGHWSACLPLVVSRVFCKSKLFSSLIFYLNLISFTLQFPLHPVCEVPNSRPSLSGILTTKDNCQRISRMTKFPSGLSSPLQLYLQQLYLTFFLFVLSNVKLTLIKFCIWYLGLEWGYLDGSSECTSQGVQSDRA
jgi:hypothetical protein